MAKILVVDDEPSIRILAKRLLALHGHKVDVAADGEKALELLVNGPAYDLAIVDHSMPLMSGVEMVGIVRSTVRYAAMKVLMFSGGGLTENVDAAFDVGADAYILKPFDAARLITKVNIMLGDGR